MTNKQKIFLNSIAGVGQLVVTTILTFLSIPLFINKLGMDIYGVFCIVSVVGNLNLFANLGLNISLLTFLSKQGKCSESDKDILVAISLLLIIIIPITAFAFWQDEYILFNILAIPTKFAPLVTDFFHYLLIANGLLLLGQIFVAILDSKQKIYISSMLQALYSAIYWIGLIITVSMGYSLPTIGFSILGASVIWFALLIYFTIKKWGIPIEKIDYHEFIALSKKHLGFGAKVSMAGFVGFFHEPLTKILISNFLGVQTVGFYDIAIKIKTQIMGLFQKILYPLYPHFSNKPIDENFKILLFSLFKKLLLICSIISIAVVLLFPTLLTFWLGQSNSTTIIFSVTIVVTTLLFSAPIIPIYSFFQVKLKPENNIIIQAVSVISNAVIFFLIIHTGSILSVVLSYLIANIAGFLVCIYFWNNFPGFPIEKKVSDLYQYLILLVIISVPSLLIFHFIDHDIVKLVLITIVLTFGSIFSFRLLKLTDKEEIDNYFQFSSNLNSWMKRVLISKE